MVILIADVVIFWIERFPAFRTVDTSAIGVGYAPPVSCAFRLMRLEDMLQVHLQDGAHSSGAIE